MKAFVFLRSGRYGSGPLIPLLRVVMLWCLIPALAAAGEERPWQDNLQIHGFLGQAYVQSSDNRFFGDSEEGSFEFTEIGVNASYRFNPSLLVAGQLLSRRAGDMYDGSPSLDYGLLDFTAFADESTRIGLIAGRFKNPFGLFNDTRDVSFTRPGIFMPQSVYYDKVRNLVLANDGVQLYTEFHGEEDSLYLQLGAGRSPIDKNVEYAYFGYDLGGDLEPKGVTLVGRIMYEGDGGRYRLGLSGAEASVEYDGATAPGVTDGTVDIIYWIASLELNGENWSLAAEYTQGPVAWDGFGPLIDERDGTAEGYYLQGSFRPKPSWELMLRYEESYANKEDKDGKEAEASAATFGLVVPNYNFFTKDWTAGIRWDINDSLMLRGEYHRINGTFMLSPRENRNPAELEQHWDLYSLLFSYRF
jgi:hypothetical protein